MKKKLIAFLSALIICGTATIGAVTVSAKKAEDSGAKTTATEKKEKKEKTPNPNISADLLLCLIPARCIPSTLL